jgi:hypothetical protein
MRFPQRSDTRLAAYIALLIAARTVISQPTGSNGDVFRLDIPKTALGASIEHDPSFASFSFEPAFWVEFFGNSSTPNKLAFNLLNRIVDHGGQPTVFFPPITALFLSSSVFNRLDLAESQWIP